MCKWGTYRKIHVIRRNNPFIEDGWHEISVDSCIADEVQMLNDNGVITLGCCCGHFKGEPNCLIDPESIEKCKELGYKPEKYKDTNIYQIKLN
jgi:hypothetical protein